MHISCGFLNHNIYKYIYSVLLCMTLSMLICDGRIDFSNLVFCFLVSLSVCVCACARVCLGDTSVDLQSCVFNGN